MKIMALLLDRVCVDVQALRQFQSSHRSPSGPLKPVPEGFMPVHARKTLPKGEK